MLCSLVISYKYLIKIDVFIFIVVGFVPLNVGTWLPPFQKNQLPVCSQ